MKLLAIVFGTFLLAACQEQETPSGEPVVLYDFFRIVDSRTYQDLFIGESNLNPEDVKLFLKNKSDQWVDAEITYTQLAGHTVFGPAIFVNYPNSTYKLELSSSDSDTIRVDATGDANHDDVFRFYYNEELNEKYDFGNEEFAYDYIEANAAYMKGKLRNLPDEKTYILTFKKEVQE